MRSSWIEIGPKSNMSVLIRDRRAEDTEHKAEGYMKTVAENGVMPPQAKEHQGFSAATRSQERDMKQLPLRVSRRNQPCRQFDFGFLASNTMKHISVVVSHPGHGNVLQQP